MNFKKISHLLRHYLRSKYHTNLNRRISFTDILFVVLGLGLFIQACDRVDAKKEMENMSLTKNDSVHPMARPPIDVSVPEKTETATFALG